METKKLKKKKFNFLKFVVVVLFLYIVVSLFLELAKSPIKNIIILNTHYLSDEDIIELAGLENYPSFVKTSSLGICKKIKKSNLVNSCKINKLFGYTIEITIEEHKILYKMRGNDKYVLSSGKEIDSLSNYNGIPVLINYVPDELKDELNEEFSLIDYDVLYKISEIEYSPTTYDNERFILYMKDGNMVYITLIKTERLNKYDEIKKKLEQHNGILYLDSGNYFEIKE